MENLTDKELEWALKLTKHKVFLSRFFIFSLFFIDLLIFYNLWYRWVIYSSQTPGYLHDQPSAKNLIDFQGFHERNKPLPIIIDTKGSLASGTKKFDYYALVRNPNSRWHAPQVVLEFRFPTQTFTKTIYNLLPGETRVAAIFARESSLADPFITEIQNTTWQRITQELPHPNNFFSILNVQHTPSELSPSYAETTFTFRNNSTYGFWQVPYTILLYEGSTLVGVNQLTTQRLNPGEEREMKTAWTGLPPSFINRVEVSIDPTAVLDPNNRYLAGQ